MLTDPTISKLKDMHLLKMAETLQNLNTRKEYADLSFESKIALMVDSEWNNKQNNRLLRLKNAAKFQIPDACPESIRYDPGRHLDKYQIAKLLTCDFIKDSLNIIIYGATGVGKSYLSCAIGISAVRNFYTVRYIRLPELCMEFEKARSDGTIQKTLKAYQKVKLLIIDEWLTFPITQENTSDLIEIFEARYNHASTILCTQFEVAGWFEKIGNPIYTDCICDRTVHNAYQLKLEGESMRKLCSKEKLDSNLT